MKLHDATLWNDLLSVNTVKAGKTFSVRNPVDNQALADIADMGPKETNIAILNANIAFSIWRLKTAKERAVLLRRWHDLILEYQDDLAFILTCEQGKPLAESKGEIAYGAAYIDWFAEEGRRLYGDIIPTTAPNQRMLVIKQPIGVVGAITPWNFPSAMIARKAAAALAAGCTFIVKPSELTPLSALALQVLAKRAGLPNGVFTVITTQQASRIGKVLTSHADIRKFTFTGSTPVGKLLAKQCVSTLKKVSLELGGNAPFIVFDDADIDAAVTGAIISKYRNAGQTCVCTNRIYVQNSILEEFLSRFKISTEALKIGSGISEGVEIGPMINQAAISKIEALVNDAVQNGASIVTGGEPLGRHFYQPTILRDVDANMKVSNTEIFGPIAPVIGFATEAVVIEQANNTPYGLAAYFYTQSLGRSWRVSEALEYGMVGINTGLISTETAPFGGIKESGYGREGSKYGLDDYTEIKYICINGLDV